MKFPMEPLWIAFEFPMESFPHPTELYRRYKITHGIKDEAEELIVQPYHVDPSGKEPRYYQANAINRIIEAVASGL